MLKNKTMHYNIMLKNKECFFKMAGLSVQHPVRLLGANMAMRMLVLFSKTWYSRPMPILSHCYKMFSEEVQAA
jgi:hypothetical protein